MENSVTWKEWDEEWFLELTLGAGWEDLKVIPTAENLPIGIGVRWLGKGNYINLNLHIIHIDGKTWSLSHHTHIWKDMTLIISGSSMLKTSSGGRVKADWFTWPLLLLDLGTECMVTILLHACKTTWKRWERWSSGTHGPDGAGGPHRKR